jgi:hypothetical protein
MKAGRIMIGVMTTILLVVSYPACGIVLTFDDAIMSSAGPIPNGYGGLNWSNFHALDDVSYNGPGSTSGYINGLVSGRYVACNPFANPAMVSDGYFDFIGAYFTGAWNEGLNIKVDGYHDDSLIYSETVVASYYSPTWYTFDFVNVNKLQFSSFGGIDADPGDSGNGEHFAMDNFTFVPEPATICLFGLGSLIFLKRRKA